MCAQLDDKSVDMILADLPYQQTACTWDTLIPFDTLWAHFKRIIKPRGAIVLTASQPFTSALVMSNVEWFRCEWIAEKPQGTGYLNANRQPMKNHENIIVFSEGSHSYYPQMRNGKAYRATSGAVGGYIRDKTVGGYVTENNGNRYPLSVINCNWDTEGLHPTEKPLDLFTYLIKTYAQPNDLVFDPVCGSGTTALACYRTGRNFICSDFTPEYVDIARERLERANPYVPTKVSDTEVQLSLFSEANNV